MIKNKNPGVKPGVKTALWGFRGVALLGGHESRGTMLTSVRPSRPWTNSTRPGTSANSVWSRPIPTLRPG